MLSGKEQSFVLQKTFKTITETSDDILSYMYFLFSFERASASYENINWISYYDLGYLV